MAKTFIIAEIAQAHDGSLGILHSYIDAISETGVDAVKFQTHIAEAESSIYEPFRVNFSYEDKTRFDYWKRMGFSFEQWFEIKNHCEKVGLEFISSPFSQEAVDLLEKLNVKRYKVGSGEISNFLILEKIARTNKEVILSSGMSSFEELDRAIEHLEKHHNKISVLQCTTAYPTPYERLGLNIITELKKRYPNYKIGLSEHTGDIYAGVAGVALGAEILEFHAVFDKRMFGPDSTSSLTIDQISTLVSGVRSIEKSLNNPIDKNDLKPFTKLKDIFEKTLAVNKDLEVGHQLKFEDLEAKKPSGRGIGANRYEEVIGRRISKSLNKWDFLTEDHLIKN
ncbi:N-acetylneuraminate synthase family protein [Portibacter marinus]|uniref:N-acetylneuraminate synthase family protein n=1 Tax=Portibacter marinus TaxID=2898660 RepID=UPI001F487591|nr:N-acetylneuraminate synthase family protein [Portibacter marinus]